MMKSSAAGLLLALVLAAPAYAAPEDVANDISKNVMSPFCPGVTLHDCPSDTATRLRAEIIEWVEEGFTRSQIIDRLERDFSATVIRATPDPGGAGIVAWILPGLAALAGAALAWHYLRRWIKLQPSPDGYDPDVHITDEDRRRLDAELRRFTGEA